MKRKYEKPLVAVENYEISQSIAACITKISFADSTCVLFDPDAPLGMRRLAYDGWFSSGCGDLEYEGGGSDDGICFHTSANAAFTS